MAGRYEKQRDMRRLFPIFILVFIIASLAILLFGDSGIFAFGRLEGYRDSLAANVGALKERHASLETELAQLKENRETTVVLARSLGLYEPGDKVVKLEGTGTRNEVYAMGDLIRRTAPQADRSAILKSVAGIAAALLIFALFLLARTPGGRKVGHRGR